MEALLVVMGVLLATMIVVAIGDRIGLPWPVLLTLVAAATMVLPGIPELKIPPELILPIFIPPLLWALARRTSWGQIKEQRATLLSLSVLLVFATTGAVAGVSMWLLPSLGLAGAIILGAALAPPDPVAVDAVAEPAGVPRRLTSTLQSEGLFNDAASIVAFHVALGALTACEDLSFQTGIEEFLYSAVVATVLGLAIGFCAAKLTDWMHSTVARNALSWVIPFVTYVVAEELHASGVIAIVIAAVEMNSRVSVNAEDRLTGHAFWETVEMLFTGVAFGLIGLSVRDAVNEVGSELWHAVFVGVVLSLVLIVVRFAWMWLYCKWNIHKGRKNVAPLRLQEVLLLTWAGMRGLVTLALVLSIPMDVVPLHHELTVIALVVLLMTMVLPGLTLPWLMRQLSLERGPDAHGDIARAALSKRAHDAALEVLHRHAEELPVGTVASFQAWLSREIGVEHVDVLDDERFDELRRHVAGIRAEALTAAQQELLDARQERGIDPAIVDEVLHTVDRMIVASRRH